jgi:hypothetical protein
MISDRGLSLLLINPHMKNALTTLSALALGIGSAVAGPMGAPPMAKGPVPPPLNVPNVCDCFDANTKFVSVYAAGMLPGSDSHHDDAFGGGISLSYFPVEMAGFEADATWFADDSVVHLITGSVVLRAPIKSSCLAPYVVAGGGIHANSVTQGVWHAGGGIDIRIQSCFGIFADARYTWTEEEDDDYTVVRGGIRFNF